jgi:hypothetical protein
MLSYLNNFYANQDRACMDMASMVDADQRCGHLIHHQKPFCQEISGYLD